MKQSVKQYCQYCFVFVLISFTVLMSQVVAQTGIQWEKDLDKAKAKASAENKPLLLHFYGDSCPPCKLMERDVFPNARVIEKMNADFIAVKIDTSRSPQLMKQYGIRSIPTDIFLSPAGEIIHERNKGTTVANFITEITSIAAKFPKPQPVQPSHTQQIAQVTQNTQNTGVTLAEYHQPNMAQVTAQSQPTAFSGYPAAIPATQVPTFTPQVQATQVESSEGFAVSGNSTGQTRSIDMAAQSHQLPMTQQAIADNQVVYQAAPPSMAQSQAHSQYVSQVAGEQQFAAAQPNQTAPLQQVIEPRFQVSAQPSNVLASQNPLQIQEQPMTQYPAMAQNPLSPQSVQLPMQPQLNQPTFVAAATPVSPAVPVGTFDNGMVRKQPTTGLGGGNSLGVVATVNDRSMAVQLPNIALDGYCPVTLAQTAKWVRGNAEVTTEYDGMVFRFASVESRNAFAANPGLYAPVLRGHDAVELLTNRREVSGHRKFGAWYHGHVFLFANAENYEKFQNNPELYAFQAQQSTNALTASTNPVR